MIWMAYGCVYKIENIKNNKVYIGRTTQKPTKRWSSHISMLKKGIHYNGRLQQSFNVHGLSNFKFRVLKYAKNDETLDKLEDMYINKYDSLNKENGYNLSSGGIKCKRSLETKKKLSDSKLGDKNPNYKKTPSSEIREKMRIRMSGKNNPMYGKTSAMKGKSQSIKARQKASMSQEGRAIFGFTGIYFRRDVNPEKKAWRAKIKYKQKTKQLGTFEDPITAEIVYKIVRTEIYSLKES